MQNRLGFIVTVIAVWGCNSGGMLIEKLAAGDECPRGGIKLTPSGKPSEIICNGQDGASASVDAVLVRQTSIEVSDNRCPRGGVELSSGLDSGAGGGTKGDGQLQDGEVTQTSVICTGDDQARVGSVDPPGGAEGTAKLLCRGGESTEGAGGVGGSIDLAISGGSNGGHLKVWKTGQVATPPAFVEPPEADLGETPLIVTSNLNVLLGDVEDDFAEGVVFANPRGLYISAGIRKPGKRVTGLVVQAGATLRLPLLDSNGPSIPHSCRIDGTISVNREVSSNGSILGLRCGDLFLSATASVVGNDLKDAPPASIRLEALGILRNDGTVDTSPQNGNAGPITLHSMLSSVFSGGTLRANGGAISGGSAGNGGTISIMAMRLLINTATIEAIGGSDSTAFEVTAGHGGNISLRSVDSASRMYNSGRIDASGGAATTVGCKACTSGQGGSISLTADNGMLSNSGELSARGGVGSTRGGNGGTVTLRIDDAGAEGSASGSLHNAGTIDVSGGDGATGGNGGTIQVQVNSSGVIGSELVLFGYSEIAADGASGPSGGRGGSIRLTQSPGEFGERPFRAGGAVINTVNMSANGGPGTDLINPEASGGNGGNISLETQRGIDQPGASWEIVRNSGALSARSGAGARGGHGGSVRVFGRMGATSRGSISVSGGAATTSWGGPAGAVLVESRWGPVDVSGEIQANAGDTKMTFGQLGRMVELRGVPVSNEAHIEAKGGGADAETGIGGEGGIIWIESLRGTSTENKVAAPSGLQVSGGAAKTPGNAGTVVIDGLSVTQHWTR